MKYREEVMSKIFTYITVIILLGIIAFEAYVLQTERNKAADLQSAYEQSQTDLKIVRELNYDLCDENAALEEFRNEWITYAAFTDVSMADRYKTDLFSRTVLIPQAALEDWQMRAYLELVEETQEESEDTEADENKDDKKDDKKEEKTEGKKDLKKEQNEEEEQEDELTPEDIEIPNFTFENPKGNNLYLQFGHTADPADAYMIYTCAYPEDESVEGNILLLYELPWDSETNVPLYDENGELIWNCIAYNIGEGWMGIRTVSEEMEEGE